MLREQLGMTQEELAHKVGYKTRSAINKIESGSRDINQSQIKLFADALQTTPAELMGWINADHIKSNNQSDEFENISNIILVEGSNEKLYFKETFDELGFTIIDINEILQVKIDGQIHEITRDDYLEYVENIASKLKDDFIDFINQKSYGKQLNTIAAHSTENLSSEDKDKIVNFVNDLLKKKNK